MNPHDYDQNGKLYIYKFIFRSGIRKITIKANDIEEAKYVLSQYEEDAWLDPSWNWKYKTIKIEVQS